MKLAIRAVVVLAVLYVGLVVLFESWLGYAQPSGNGNIVLTMTDSDGSETVRVLSPFESQETLYLAANHWPRGWFWEVQGHEEVHVAFVGDDAARTGRYSVHVIDGDEHDRVATDTALPFFIRFLTGFPPREFVRLEPVTG